VSLIVRRSLPRSGRGSASGREDTQRYRLGVNFSQIPVNAPRCPFHSYHRDGAMRTDGNLGPTPTYWPNSLGEWIDQPDLNEPPLDLEGAEAHWDHRVDDDHYQQPGDLFRKMSPAQRQALFDNTARSVGGAARHIQERHIANCAKADPEYGAGVAAALVRLAGCNPATNDRQSAAE
jgi:catalase